MACGWHSEMQNYTYTSPADVEADMKSLDFLAACGIQSVSDSHPWGGEIDKINQVGADGHFEIGELPRQFLDHSRKVGVDVVMWSTITNSHPWWDGHGKGFRRDKPEWHLRPDKTRYQGRYGGDLANLLDRMPPGNCVANKPFMDWLSKLNLDIARDGQFRSWVVDGDFFGTGGYYTTIVPVTCLAENHDHLPGDANFCCQRASRASLPTCASNSPTCIFSLVARPRIWAFGHCTISTPASPLSKTAARPKTWPPAMEFASGRGFASIATLFRTTSTSRCCFLAARVRIWQPTGGGRTNTSTIFCSAPLSSAPNQLFYLPTKGGIPEEDKATLRHWLDWGRAHARHLLVRQDLPDWPAKEKVDGSAHIVEDEGLVFLFNSGKQPLEGEFR